MAKNSHDFLSDSISSEQIAASHSHDTHDSSAGPSMSGHHHHSAEEYKQLQRRISIIVGHVASIKKMIESERDCSDILIQISAVQASLNNLGKIILKNHINECLCAAGDCTDSDEHQKEIDYLIDAIDKFIR